MSDAPPTVSPYLTIRNASEAIDFYTRAFGAEEENRHMADDGTRVMHASLRINGGAVMLSDEFPECGGAKSPQSLGGSSVSISLLFDDSTKLDDTYRRAIENGAESDMEPQEPFWGGWFAMLRDPFGHRWMLSAPPKP
jgi:PhnB protein